MNVTPTAPSDDKMGLARALFEEVGDALFLLDPETDKLVDVNPTALRMTGFTRAELLQVAATYLFRYEASGGLQRLRGAFSKTMVFHSQDGFLLRTKDDAGWVPVNLTVSRLHVRPKPLGLIIARDDRERRAAYAQTRRVEAELRQVLASSPAALWSAERAPGPDVFAGWQFRYVSPLLARIAGRPPEFFDHPLKWLEVVHPADREAHRADFRRLLTGTAAEAELAYRVAAPGGGVRWVREKLQVVRDASERPLRLDGCLSDVTDQRQAEEAVRQSEQRFRALVERSRDGIALLDEKGCVRYVSPSSRQILGHEPAAWVGKDAFDLIHPADVAVLRDELAYALRRPGEEVSCVVRAAAAGGGYRTVELNGCNRLDDPSVRAVVVNFRDVTDKERAARELADQHALLGGLFDSLPDMICYKDRDLRFLGGNRAFEALAGMPMGDLVGRACTEVFAGDWADRVRDAERRVLATGVTARAEERIDLAGGRRATLEITVAPLRAAGGGTGGVIVVGRDLTERNLLEDQLREAQKLEAVGQLAGGVAHDFNNLLTVILGNLELVRSGIPGLDHGELLAATEQAARQAADLTKQMLGVARRQPVRLEPVDLGRLVPDTVGLLRRTIDPRIVTDSAAAPGLWAALADPGQVQQIVMNLCLNARDAMPDGGRLTLRAENVTFGDEAGRRHVHARPGEYVRVTVADTGTGMPPEVRGRMFEPFFTTKEVGKGTGLGLAVAFGIVRTHGGWIECDSEVGKGTRFAVYLPRATEPTYAPRPSADGAAPAGRGETVLLADDEALVRDVARNTLAGLGYRVVVATDGAEAVEAFVRERDRVRLVILDVTMPNVSGKEAFARIRAIDPGATVLFASGHAEANALPFELDAACGFLNKPYTPSTLAAAVRRALNGSCGQLG